jgi:hypothetical protein
MNVRGTAATGAITGIVLATLTLAEVAPVPEGRMR